MPNLYEILYKAYRFTKSHKNLWFFGLFLTGWGVMNFIRRVDFQAERLGAHYYKLLFFVQRHPQRALWLFAAGLLIAVVASLLGAVARSAIIHSADQLDKKEIIILKNVFKHVRKPMWRIFWAGLFTNACIVFFLTLLALPLWLIFHFGLQSRGLLLAIIALMIFVPIIITLSIVNILTACYVVIYNLKLKQAFASAFDLLASFWEEIITLFAILFVVYFFLFFISAGLLGLIGLLAYAPTILLKSLSLQASSSITLTFILILSFAMLAVNAILNVFTNFAWTLFFLEIVKAKFVKDAKPIAQTMGG